ncbi:MAG: hypothetical protein K8I30_00525, partial [Anaerolineae bacterium]|nr:hypothetical protein [Anaerolineae bacterium]
MAVRDDLIEALNTCIDRLNQREGVEIILTDYPTLANDLRPMLEAGLLFPRARIPAPEIEPGETTGEALIRQTIRQVFRGGIGWLLLLLLLVGGGIIVIAVLVRGGGENPALIVPASATSTLTAIVAPSATATVTITQTPTG